jgi:hypothetical protein
MPFRVFALAFDPATGTFNEDELNRFCLGKRLLSHRAEFFSVDGRAYWSVFLEYEPVLEPRPKKLEDELDAEQRLLFDALRQWRREEADRQGAPVFIIANNALLSEIARHPAACACQGAWHSAPGPRPSLRIGREAAPRAWHPARAPSPGRQGRRARLPRRAGSGNDQGGA